MTRTPDDFVKLIERQRTQKVLPNLYGANVLPLITLYKELDDPGENKSFQDAIEMLLTGGTTEQRSYVVTLCLGFLVFRDAV